MLHANAKAHGKGAGFFSPISSRSSEGLTNVLVVLSIRVLQPLCGSGPTIPGISFWHLTKAWDQLKATSRIVKSSPCSIMDFCWCKRLDHSKVFFHGKPLGSVGQQTPSLHRRCPIRTSIAQLQLQQWPFRQRGIIALAGSPRLKLCQPSVCDPSTCARGFCMLNCFIHWRSYANSARCSFDIFRN